MPPPRTAPPARGTQGSRPRATPARLRTAGTGARGSRAAAACHAGPPCTPRTRLVVPTRHRPPAARCTAAPAPPAPAVVARCHCRPGPLRRVRSRAGVRAYTLTSAIAGRTALEALTHRAARPTRPRAAAPPPGRAAQPAAGSASSTAWSGRRARMRA
jgi:hypothetical protein